MTELVNQPSAMPSRKIMVSMGVGLVLVALNKTLPILFPVVLTPAYEPLYSELLMWAPLIAASAGYFPRERAAA